MSETLDQQREHGPATPDRRTFLVAAKAGNPRSDRTGWLMAQKPWIVPIPGTMQMPHMLENAGAAALRFMPAELAELNAAVSAIEARGARLPEQVLVYSGVEAPPKTRE